MRSMPQLLALALGLWGASFGQQGCARSRMPTPAATPGVPTVAAHPATVPALRYRSWISLQAPRNDLGYWREHLWFPQWKLEASTGTDAWDGPPRLNVWTAEWPHANTTKGAAWIPAGGDPREPYRGPTEEVEVPWELAQRIRAAGELRVRLESARDAVGPDLAVSGLLREVPEDDTRQ